MLILNCRILLQVLQVLHQSLHQSLRWSLRRSLRRNLERRHLHQSLAGKNHQLELILGLKCLRLLLLLSRKIIALDQQKCLDQSHQFYLVMVHNYIGLQPDSFPTVGVSKDFRFRLLSERWCRLCYHLYRRFQYLAISDQSQRCLHRSMLAYFMRLQVLVLFLRLFQEF